MATTATAERVTIPVGGMTCAACQAHVQKALAEQPGVRDASVNLMMGSASVTFDPSVIAPPQLVQAIKDTGYDATLPAPVTDVVAEQDARDRRRTGNTARSGEGDRQRHRRRRRDGRVDAADERPPHTVTRAATRSCAG